MQIIPNAELCDFHTFSIQQTCKSLIIADSVEDIIQIYQNEAWAMLPKLVIGKGSNLLFTSPFNGIVIVNNLRGKSIHESESHWHLHISAGEDWPTLVGWTTDNGYFGLENLAQIPGCCGSAPIQNIGAYGVELSEVCEYVDILCLETYTTKRLTNDECQFGYRDSIFKRSLFGRAIIIAIGLILKKKWQANLSYGPLQTLDSKQTSAKEVFNKVTEIRAQKLPDPSKLGNAGSFFKNPIIQKAHFLELQKRFPDIIGYPHSEGVKIAAGWLIEHSGLKGCHVGGAQVHPQQALVLINRNCATSQDIIELAHKVQATVFSNYQIQLEHEVRFIGSSGETDLQSILEQKS